MRKQGFAAVLAAVAWIGLGFVAPPARADVVFTGSTLGDLNLSVPALGLGDTGSANFDGTNINLAVGNNFLVYSDMATITIPNGLDGASFTTLNALLAAGTAADISFNLVSFGDPGNNGPYWNVLLSDPSNAANTVEWNAFGTNADGTNAFNQGDAVDASCNNQGHCVFGLWSLVTAMVVDGTPLGSWNVANLTISVGGQDDHGPSTAVIGSVTVTGNADFPPATVPEPASLALLGPGLALLGLVRFGRRPGGLSREVRAA